MIGHFAITGGIGSGKSYVCHTLEAYGIKVYDCDAAAKRLWATDRALQNGLKAIVGDEVYKDGNLQKGVLATFLLQSVSNKLAVDNLVHPAVALDFLQSGLRWLESAVFFDSGFYKRLVFDFTVCVSAPLDVRVERVMRRDGINRERAMEWMARQWPQEEVERHSDFVIVNDGHRDLNEQVMEMLNRLNQLNLSSNRQHINY